MTIKTDTAPARSKRTQGRARHKRRPDARPEEIVDAARWVFDRKGYMAATLDQIAERAGIAKGTVFLYFASKEALFRAVADAAMSSNLARLRRIDGLIDKPWREFSASIIEDLDDSDLAEICATARFLVTAAWHFPDLLGAWHDRVGSPALDRITGVLERAQVRGEVRAGDPRLQAFSLIGPLVANALYQDCFASDDPDAPNLEATAALQAVNVVVDGLMPDSGPPSSSD